MKFTSIATTGKLEFNDLGKVVKGVSPQDRFVVLNPSASIYLPDGQDVMYSAQAGDAKRYVAAGKLTVNDSVAIGATLVATHNFNFIPVVTVAKSVAGAWVAALVGTDYTASTNAAMTVTTIVNLSGVALNVRIS